MNEPGTFPVQMSKNFRTGMEHGNPLPLEHLWRMVVRKWRRALIVVLIGRPAFPFASAKEDRFGEFHPPAATGSSSFALTWAATVLALRWLCVLPTASTQIFRLPFECISGTEYIER